MIDQRNTNPMTVTGTPTLVAGALSLDTNQGLLFNGPTSFYQATDSTSLSITGSLSLEFFVKFASLPGSTKDIVSKASSYAAQLNTSGKLLFRIDNGGSNVTVTSNATLSTGTWYHIVCVLNQGYAGAQTFGETADGATTMFLEDDNGSNKVVNKFTLPEAAILNTVSTRIQYFDEIWAVQARAVVYTDSGGVPNNLVTFSEMQTLNIPNPAWRTMTTIAFPLAPVVVQPGDYNIGLITDTVAGIPKVALQVSLDTSGGDLVKRPDSVSGNPADPFGAPVTSNDDVMTIWCDYTAIARTGFEGTAAVYINGAFDNSAAYTSGIADNANALQISPSAAFNVDEVSVWNRVLTPLEIATHYLAR